MEELVLPKPDLQKLMAVMPNFEDFEELIIRRLECGGRGTVRRRGGYDADTGDIVSITLLSGLPTIKCHSNPNISNLINANW